jgi:hypothetical protein
MPGTLTIAGMAAGLKSGINTIGPVTSGGVSTVGSRIDAQLAIGDNTFQLPEGETVVSVAVFLGTVTATVKIRTNLNEADGGLQIAPAQGAGTPWSKWELPVGTTKVILHSSTVIPEVEVVFQ